MSDGPPGFWPRLLGHVAPPEDREALLGDLEEEFRARAERDPDGARRWLRGQALRSLLPLLVRRARRARWRLDIPDTLSGAPP